MKKILLALMSLLLVSCASADAEMYRQGDVYVFYERTGAAAVNLTDVNQNSVPDAVEDIATQINAARELFHDVCGFPDPLKSERYKNTSVIEVDINPKAKMNNHNGLAHSGKRKSKTDPNVNALHVQIASSVNPHTNSTPAHEYFHLIQYGMTYFRNGWYLEGMARWSQDSVQEIKEYPKVRNLKKTLKSDKSAAEIFTAKYNAAKLLWHPLAVNCKDKIEIPKSLIEKYRYADGSPVFEDDIIYGANVMKKVLSTMHEKEEQAAESFGGLKQWRKDGVRSEENNEIILESVREVYKDY